MKSVLAAGFGLYFGLLTVAVAGEDAPSPANSNTSGASLGKPAQAKTASGITLGRPIAGRARVEEPSAPAAAAAPAPALTAPATTPPASAGATAPEPVRAVSFDKAPQVLPPALESPYSAAATENARKAAEVEAAKKAAEAEAAKKTPEPEVI